MATTHANTARAGHGVGVRREAALRQLPDDYARALRLRDEGQSETAIAAALGIDPGAVGTLVTLADAQLARVLARPPSAEAGSS